jgi:hypothetical protein
MDMPAERQRLKGITTTNLVDWINKVNSKLGQLKPGNPGRKDLMNLKRLYKQELRHRHKIDLLYEGPGRTLVRSQEKPGVRSQESADPLTPGSCLLTPGSDGPA